MSVPKDSIFVAYRKRDVHTWPKQLPTLESFYRDYYELKDEARGPGGGFVYKRRQNRKGEEVGGIAPHVTLESTANDEPPKEEVLVDRPEVVKGITRVSGPFCVEATIPTPMDWETGDGVEPAGTGKPSRQPDIFPPYESYHGRSRLCFVARRAGPRAPACEHLCFCL